MRLKNSLHQAARHRYDGTLKNEEKKIEKTVKNLHGNAGVKAKMKNMFGTFQLQYLSYLADKRLL